MRILTVLSFLTATLLLAGSCAVAPPGTPDQVASDLLADVDAGRAGQARSSFQRATASGVDAERLYPILHGEAQARYEAGEHAGAARLLRFLTAVYPDAVGARQGLVYALFMERAGRPQADPEIAAELERELALLAGAPAAEPWLDLVATQNAIDQDRVDEARGHFDSFLAAWDGEPQELFVYVEDLDRYLASH